LLLKKVRFILSNSLQKREAAASIWIAQEISGDGESNWLEGVQLLSVYFIIAILFFFLPDNSHQTAAP